ncbi:MAG: superoxide dismutase [Thermonema sp.]|jgi:Fe-Mn family superoxide dismutase|uniref:superoxide dismutase n=1 Tax=Thermonema sp. TaxID=2231181 RepID=UPI0021DE860E|nr:superoxide dismutase [Thermonema sp.]GIV40034.1 MAG: superoxide dismutase [Thermonema sp.]
MAFEQVKLPYAEDALEPYIDAQTMNLHYTKHHAGYTAKLNDAVKGTALEGMSIEDIFKNVSKHPVAVRNNGGGFYNHNLYWQIMSPKGGELKGNVVEAIKKKWGNFDAFKAEFSQAAAGVFGSGWAWLIVKDGELLITQTPNQDNPLMDVAPVQGVPVLGIDVWEHAYYLKYQNRRPEYIEAFYNVINWEKVNEFYELAIR